MVIAVVVAAYGVGVPVVFVDMQASFVIEAYGSMVSLVIDGAICVIAVIGGIVIVLWIVAVVWAVVLLKRVLMAVMMIVGWMFSTRPVHPWWCLVTSSLMVMLCGVVVECLVVKP